MKLGSWRQVTHEIAHRLELTGWMPTGVMQPLCKRYTAWARRAQVPMNKVVTEHVPAIWETQQPVDPYERETGHKIWCTAGFNSQCQCGARPDLAEKKQSPHTRWVPRKWEWIGTCSCKGQDADCADDDRNWKVVD